MPRLANMTYCTTDRWGAMQTNSPIEHLRALLRSLDVDDDEHPDVALKHETEWCLSAFPSGLLVWENVEGDSGPRHMKCVPRERVLRLWLELAQGDIAAVEAEPWLPGYG
jgi:hypothetical protein